GFRDLNDQINWMGNEDIIPMLRTDHVQEATSADESHGRDPALPKVGDMLVLSMYGDDLGLDRFGIVTSIEDGSMTAVIGDGTRADGQRGVVTRTFTQDDGRLLGSIDTINVKDVARPVPPPPPPPPSPAVTSPAVKSRPHLRGDLGNPDGNPVFEETLDRLERIGEIMGQPLVVRSGSRTLAEQKSLWDLHAANPSKPIAAFPRADAPHIRGIAADVGVGPVGEGVSLYNVKGSSAAVASVNMAFTMLHRGEPWHIQQSGPWQR
ncbi:MAG: hypothetical protein H7287_07170, partial [Thermoleophilia bacterium]|nr:hypothetical protein [Thermoleophilia bacterium]